MKKCGVCEEIKEEKQFAFKNKKLGTLNSRCKSCHKIYRDKHYQDNKEYYRNKADVYKLEIREWFEEYLKDKKCINCGEDERCCFDFHHLDPKEKDTNVSQAVVNAWSKKRIMKEIDKCVILCANCHRKLHKGVVDLAGVI